MPPPKFAPIKKRKSKRAADYAQSQPSRTAVTDNTGEKSGGESDSDVAAGFGTNWQATV